MKNLYNTTFEVSLRLMILLEVADKPLNIDKITYLDFMSVYAKEFGLSDKNLNGENHYKYGEISAKRRSITAALKRLVIDRFVKATVNPSGLVYSIDVIGKNYANSLDSEYAQEYKTAVQFVFSSFGDMDEKEISSIIKEIIIDSPIMALTERESNNSNGMKAALFEYLVKNNNYGQVIIAENEIPNINYKNTKLIEFSGLKDKGRCGFLINPN